MKIKCDFCKTEYVLNNRPSGSVRCAVCGHVWTPRVPLRQSSMMKFIAAICAFVAACIFSFVVIFNFKGRDVKPLVVKLDGSDVRVILDKDGNKRIFVSGDITNTTDDIYGLPNVIIISYDENENVSSRQAFTPPATLLESKTTVTFNYMLSVNPARVKRLSVELKESK